MRWLSWIRTHLGHDGPDHVEKNENSANEAQAALLQAHDVLDQARKRREEFKEVTTDLVGLNDANHYGEAIYLSMMPKRNRT